MPLPHHPLSAHVWIAPQIGLGDLETAAGLGVRQVISNRPDGEDAGQPSAAEMATAAQALGLRFIHAPVMGMPGPAAVSAVAGALSDDTPTLLFCRSGMRSAMTWAMAMRSLNRGEPEALREAAAGAGYDLSRLPL